MTQKMTYVQIGELGPKSLIMARVIKDTEPIIGRKVGELTPAHTNSHLEAIYPTGIFLGSWRRPKNPEEIHMNGRNSTQTVIKPQTPEQ